MSDENLALWRAVGVTDPRYTKKVNQRGGYTSISAQYQLLQATTQWGPMGDRWRVDTTYQVMPVGEELLIAAEVTLTYPAPSGKPAVVGGIVASEYLLRKGKVDEDAWKKARTNALTKTLSQLGFSADVFMGMFDQPGYERQALSITEQRKKAGSAVVTAPAPERTPMEEIMDAPEDLFDAGPTKPGPESSPPSGPTTTEQSTPTERKRGGMGAPVPCDDKPKRKKRACSKCRQPGHTAKTCGKQEAPPAEVPDVAKVSQEIRDLAGDLEGEWGAQVLDAMVECGSPEELADLRDRVKVLADCLDLASCYAPKHEKAALVLIRENATDATELAFVRDRLKKGLDK